jgi:hypothetical protein
MKTKTVCCLLVAAAFLIGACGAAATPSTAPSPTALSAPSPAPSSSRSPTSSVSPLGFEAAPWGNGSTASYEWQQDASGAQIGTTQVAFSLSGGVWTISEKDDITGLEQSFEMRIDAATLAPLGETKVITTADTTVDLETKYENGTLSINAVVNGKTQTASIDVPANAVDNDQLLMTLRALPFADGLTDTYTVIVAQSALKVDTTVSVVGQESVTVPAGTYDTWHVQISAAQAKQDVWYQVGSPHMLIEYDNGTTRMVLAQ